MDIRLCNIGLDTNMKKFKLFNFGKTLDKRDFYKPNIL